MTNDNSAQTLHASCVSLMGAGVLLLGAPGSGKSDLALRLIDMGAQLVADDQVRIAPRGPELVAAAPTGIAGLLEVRGVGIYKLKHAPAALKLAVQLVKPEEVERLPEAQFMDCLGLKLPLLSLAAFEAGTPAKIRLALRAEKHA